MGSKHFSQIWIIGFWNFSPQNMIYGTKTGVILTLINFHIHPVGATFEYTRCKYFELPKTNHSKFKESINAQRGENG